MLKEALIAGAIVSAVPGAAVSQVSGDNVVKIGLVDVAATRFMDGDRNASIEYREFNDPGSRSGFWPMANEIDHGVVMASMVLDQIRTMDKAVRVKVFAANVMQMSDKDGGLMLSSAGALKALDWFAQNDVKVVMTTFVGRDTHAIRAFMDEAKRHDMVVFASAGNNVVPGQRSFPAAYPDAISVVGSNPKLGLVKDASIASWVSFAVDGETDVYSVDGHVDTAGSSMSVARAVGIGVYAMHLGKASDTSGLKEVMSGISTERKVPTAQHLVAVSYIDYKKAGAALRASPVASVRPLEASRLSASVSPPAADLASLDRNLVHSLAARSVDGLSR